MSVPGPVSAVSAGLLLVGAWPGERLYPGSTQDRGSELWGRRTGFGSQLREIEQIGGHYQAECFSHRHIRQRFA